MENVRIHPKAPTNPMIMPMTPERRAPFWIAALLAGAFAIFHGHAHGTELPHAANPVAYASGFVLATGGLHLCGIVFGMLSRYPLGEYAVRVWGGAIALIGLAFVTGYA